MCSFSALGRGFHRTVLKRIIQSNSLIIIALSICACATKPKPKEPDKAPASTDPTLVGRVASIPASKRFVLIQAYGKWNQPAGTILTTRGPQSQSANLLVTGESLGQFAAADIQAGEAAIGDAVYSQHTPQPPSQTQPPTPQEPLPVDPLELPAL